MKIFVTGATGFVGSHLAEKLIGQGHEVFCLVRSNKKAKQYPFLTNIVTGSLHHDNIPAFIDELPHDLDLVIHTAGIVHSHNIKNFHDVNNKATQFLFKGLKDKYKKLHFTFISSLASSGPSLDKIKINEESKQVPVSEYGKSKYNAEIFLKENLPKDYGLTIIRPPMVIGPRDAAVLDIFKMVESGFVITPGLNGKKKQYSFVCVFDLVDVIIKASLSQTSQIQVYFASFPKVIEFCELVKSISLLMGNKKLIYLGIPSLLIKGIGYALSFSNRIISNDLRLTKDKTYELIPDSWTCDAKKSQTQLNHDYIWDLEKTIKITYEDYKKAGLLKK